MFDTKHIKDAEFRGFFFADGCAQIVRYKHNSYYKGKKSVYDTFRAQLSIVQRDDNVEFLEEIQKEYGGSIYKNNIPKSSYPNSKPRKTWVCTNLEINLELCKILLNTQFTYRNIDAVRAVKEYCEHRLKFARNAKHKKGDKEYYQSLRERVEKAHRYQE